MPPAQFLLIKVKIRGASAFFGDYFAICFPFPSTFAAETNETRYENNQQKRGHPQQNGVRHYGLLGEYTIG